MKPRIYAPHFVLVLSVVASGDAFTVGPPPLPTVCRTMNPQHHDYKAQGTESPFQVSVDRAEITGGQSVIVNLATLDPSTKFIGFYLQARDDDDNAIGEFTPNTDTKVHTCFGKRANAAHHYSGLVKKDNITIVWTPARNFQGEVVMTATMMRDFVTYWVFLQSTPLLVKLPEGEVDNNVPPPLLPRTTGRPRPNLNETLVNLFDNIGAIFRPRIRSNSSTNGSSNGRCQTDRVFNQWFCNLFSNPNAVGGR